MPTFVAFLRAVNVGKRKYPMAELRAALGAAGCTGVETHIQTGNVLFGTSTRSRHRVVEALERTMREDRGFEVPVVLFAAAELTDLVAEAEDFAEGRSLRAHYLTLLAVAPADTVRERVEAGWRDASPDEQVRIGRRAVHLMVDKPYHEVTLTNAAVERELGVATTRNLTVIRKLAEKWGT